MTRKNNGFTLLELVIVVAIIAIIAGIAIPNYEEYVTRGRRTDATAALMEMANLQTRFFSNNFRYTATLASLPYATSSMEGYYNLTAAVTTTSFTLTATAQGGQAANDAGCVNIVLTNLGAKTPVDCW